MKYDDEEEEEEKEEQQEEEEEGRRHIDYIHLGQPSTATQLPSALCSLSPLLFIFTCAIPPLPLSDHARWLVIGNRQWQFQFNSN